MPDRDVEERRDRTLAEGLAFAGLALYVIAAPHSIAGSWIGLSIAVLGWLGRAFVTRTTGFQRSRLDAPLWLLFGWTVLSSGLSYEPDESLGKLVNVSTFLVFYIVQATLTRARAVILAGLLIISGVAGVLWSVGEIVVGRGVVVREVHPSSPFRTTLLQPGDAIWRVNERRVSSIAEIDEAIRRSPPGAPLRLSVISRGEHVEWQARPPADSSASQSPSGLEGEGRTHRFRASGWTRHYETHAEVLQMLAQLALGFALAFWLRGGPRRFVVLGVMAFAILAAGIALTAMRTVLVAFAIGALALAWRASASTRVRLAIAAAVVIVLAAGALTVSRTRAGGALLLSDPSAASRFNIARIAANRVPQHPVFGHGMDAVHRHWKEWGFPGTDMLHAHSTPVQLAFDRGLPAVAMWLWLMIACWATASKAERMWRETDNAPTHGLVLGSTGAVVGLFASSIVNYNFGDAEVTLLLWWLMGAVVATAREEGREAVGAVANQPRSGGRQ